PFTFDLSQLYGCDEVPQLLIKLVPSQATTGTTVIASGLNSVVRMQENYPDVDPATEKNTRIGWERATGDVILTTTSGGAFKVGTFVMTGTIGTNAARPPLFE